VTTLALATLVQVSLLTMGTETYAEAYRATEETRRPLVVMIGAEWCAACQVMERTVLPQVRERGVLGKVGFAIVNLDRERELSDQVTNRGPIPQLLLFRKAEDGWKLRRLIGSHSVEAVEQFINQGVQADQAHVKTKLEAEEDTPPVKVRLASQGAAGGEVRPASHPIGR